MITKSDTTFLIDINLW